MLTTDGTTTPDIPTTPVPAPLPTAGGVQTISTTLAQLEGGDAGASSSAIAEGGRGQTKPPSSANLSLFNTPRNPIPSSPLTSAPSPAASDNLKSTLSLPSSATAVPVPVPEATATEAEAAPVSPSDDLVIQRAAEPIDEGKADTGTVPTVDKEEAKEEDSVRPEEQVALHVDESVAVSDGRDYGGGGGSGDGKEDNDAPEKKRTVVHPEPQPQSKASPEDNDSSKHGKRTPNYRAMAIAIACLVKR